MKKLKTKVIEKPTEPKYDRYWVSDGDYIFELPPDAPVRSRFEDKILKISDCRIFDCVEFFRENKWVEIDILRPPKKYSLHIEYEEQTISRVDEEYLIEEYTRKHKNAKVTIKAVEELCKITNLEELNK